MNRYYYLLLFVLMPFPLAASVEQGLLPDTTEDCYLPIEGGWSIHLSPDPDTPRMAPGSCIGAVDRGSSYGEGHAFYRPVQGDINNTGRTQERREMIITRRFTLRAGAKCIDVTTSFENTCKHHRLRVVFPTRLDCDRTDAEIAYDVIGRDIHIKESSPYYGHPNPQYPMHRFVDMTDGECGFAVINNCGLREYEAMDKADRPLAITLLRAFTYRNSPVFGRWETYPDMELAQCVGKFEWNYALYPHGGDWMNGCYREAEDMNLPLEPAQAGPHEGTLPKALSFLTLEGENLQITALKQAEDRPGNYILRLFNPTQDAVNGALVLFKDIREAWLTNMDEERQEALKPQGNRLEMTVPKKKILTIEFCL